jgi:glycosyltransferase involved in cell wall biosynthesis
MVKRVTLVFDAHEPNYYALWPDRWRFVLRIVEGVDMFFSRRADAVTVTNDYQVAKYRQGGVKRVELIGNYASPDLRAPEGQLPVAAEAPYMFGRFGTFYPDVGLEETLQALRRVIPRHPEVRFLVAGRVVDTYQERFLAEIAPLGDHVVCTGPYPSSEMPRLYRQIRVPCLIYPKSEWFRNITPRKFFDSLTNGVPVLMTDIGGLGEVVRRHHCGLVVDEKDLDGICEAMETLLSRPDLVQEMSRNALALARSEYSWDAVVRKYARLIEEIHAG